MPTQKKTNRYYLMRHGESLANRNGVIVSDPKNALDNYGLTAFGAQQVLKAALNTRLGRDTIIVTSDFKRAQETAEIMASVLDTEVALRAETLFRERRFGAWELSDQSNYEKVWQHDLTDPHRRNDEVETVQEVLDRGQKLIDALEEQYDSKPILLVGHGDVLQIMLASHHNINPRFHRSLTAINNADIRSLAQLELANKGIA